MDEVVTIIRRLIWDVKDMRHDISDMNKTDHLFEKMCKLDEFQRFIWMNNLDKYEGKWRGTGTSPRQFVMGKGPLPQAATDDFKNEVVYILCSMASRKLKRHKSVERLRAVASAMPGFNLAASFKSLLPPVKTSL